MSKISILLLRNPIMEDIPLLHLVQTILEKSLIEDKLDEYHFAPEKVVTIVTRILTNFITLRDLSVTANLQRILLPYGWDGEKFRDGFGIKDLLDDIKGYRQENWLFLTYEISGVQHDGTWKVEANFRNLDTAFLSMRNISPETHHVTKLYYKLEDEGKTFMYFGTRVYPSIHKI